MKSNATGPTLALLALIGVAVIGLSSNQTKKYHCTQPANTEQQHNRTSDLAPATKQDENGSPAEYKENWYDTFLEHTPDWFVALFTAVLVFVTWRLVVSTNRLWLAGERQMRLTRTMALNQHAQTRESNEIARQSADLHKSATIALNRAYLTVEAFVSTAGGTPVKGYTFGAKWKNTGNTPANRAKGWSVFGIFDEDIPSDFSFKKPSFKIDDYKITFGAGAAYTLGSSAGVAIETLRLVQSGEKVAYFWGEIEYSDIFEGTPPHITKFCVRIVVVGTLGDSQQGAKVFDYIAHHKNNESE